MRIKQLGGPGNVGFRAEDQKGWLTAAVAMTEGLAYPVDEVNLADDGSYDRILTNAVPSVANFYVIALETVLINQRCHVQLSGVVEAVSDGILATVGLSATIDAAGELVVAPTTAGTRIFAKNLEVTTADNLHSFVFEGYGFALDAVT